MRTDGRFVYDFDEPSEGGRELLGGKGIGLAEMTQLGVPVPAGFTVTTDACRAYMANGKALPDGLEAEIAEHLGALEERTGKRFGDPSDPLLVSVRSGAAVSMPGMMDTILNLGLNDEAVEGLARTTGQPALRLRLLPAPDPDVRRGRRRRRRRAVRARAHRAEERARRRSRTSTSPPTTCAELVGTFKRIYEEDDRRGRSRRTRRSSCAARCKAVFDSWDTPRAQVYRRAQPHPGGPRHRRQRRPDGLRQQGRRRRGPAWRSRATRRPASRGSTASSSPTRRARTSSPASARREPLERDGRSGCPEAFEQLLDDDAAPRGALPRHAGHRVHGRGREALPPADALGEADRGGRAPGGRRRWSTRA